MNGNVWGSKIFIHKEKSDIKMKTWTSLMILVVCFS